MGWKDSVLGLHAPFGISVIFKLRQERARSLTYLGLGILTGADNRITLQASSRRQCVSLPSASESCPLSLPPPTPSLLWLEVICVGAG